MKASKFSDAQKAFIIKQGEEGTSVTVRAVGSPIGQVIRVVLGIDIAV